MTCDSGGPLPDLTPQIDSLAPPCRLLRSRLTTPHPYGAKAALLAELPCRRRQFSPLSGQRMRVACSPSAAPLRIICKSYIENRTSYMSSRPAAAWGRRACCPSYIGGVSRHRLFLITSGRCFTISAPAPASPDSRASAGTSKSYIVHRQTHFLMRLPCV